MKIPSMQFYPADWRKDPAVQSLDFFEKGVWIEMLCLMHESSERGVLLLNDKPMPEDALANAIGLDKQKITSVITKLITYGVAKRRESDGAIYSSRMVRDESLLQKRRESGALGGNPLFSKGKGNPYYKQDDKRDDNQIDNQIDKQKITPSSSSSSSSSSSDIKTPLPPKGDLGLFQKFWEAYPKKISKGQAERAFSALKPKPDEQLVETMISTIKRARASDQWKRDGGKYIPNPATWLRAKGWEDEFSETFAEPEGVPGCWELFDDKYPEAR